MSELEHHEESIQEHAKRIVERTLAAETFKPEQKPAEPVSDAEIAALVQSIIPAGMPITPPADFRRYVFATEICERLKAFGFEKRFWQDGLLENPQPKSRESRQAYVLAKTLSYLNNSGAIVALSGDRGLGKTTIAAQIAIMRLWEDWDSRYSGGSVTHRITSYRKLTAVVGRLKALYGDFGTIGIEQLESIRDHLASVELLVIDELNECADDSKHKDRILADLIDRRYASNRDTLVITNQPVEEFRRTVNPSILSRLNEHGGIIACDWESFRG